VEDQLDLLQGAKYFSTLDLKDGFFHILMDEQSSPAQKLTAFIVRTLQICAFSFRFV
jgi:hypothetical protein